MGTFSVISVEANDKYSERYRAFNLFGNKFKKIIMPYMPDYLYGIIKDMGLQDTSITGYRICVPPLNDNKELMLRNIRRAIGKGNRLGADIFVVDLDAQFEDTVNNDRLKISKGLLYPPYIFINAIKTVSALMGINFQRCNICIADAATTLGTIVTELLLCETAYLTLCTDNKEKLMERTNDYILESGLSPAVASNYRKAICACDILIYTGNENIGELSSYLCKKSILVNLTNQEIVLEKDILVIDEVILKGGRDPDIKIKNPHDAIPLTSRLWEGALLTLTDIDPVSINSAKALKLGSLGEKLGIRITTINGKGKTIDRESVYRFK